MEGIPLKQYLYATCKERVQNRLELSKAAMDDAQNFANNEEKSSAGDKYETSRAMGHLNRDMNAKQLSDAIDTMRILNSLDASRLYASIQVGAVALTSMGNYFLAVSAGSVLIDNQEFFAISPITPIGQLLLNKKKGESIYFNKNEVLVLEVI